MGRLVPEMGDGQDPGLLLVMIFQVANVVQLAIPLPFLAAEQTLPLARVALGSPSWCWDVHHSQRS